MFEYLEEKIFEAALKASYEMGLDLKKMSCFVSNWKQQYSTNIVKRKI